MTRIGLDFGGPVDVLYVADIAVKFRMSEAAVRAAVLRDSNKKPGYGALPPPFKLGSKLAWRASDVDAWLAAKAGGRA